MVTIKNTYTILMMIMLFMTLHVNAIDSFIGHSSQSFDSQRPDGISDSKWSSLKRAEQVSKLIANDDSADSRFGGSVSLSGNRALIGAYLDDENGEESGAVYIYDFDTITNSWQETKLTASDGAAGNWFGASVSLSGNRALIGAYLDDDRGTSSGSAYIYDFDSISNSWQETKLTASDGIAGDFFGASVSLSGNRALVGAPENNDSGSAYIYAFNASTNSWEEMKLFAGDRMAGDFFGVSVSLSGNRALIGSLNNNETGSAYIYAFNASTNSWHETKLIASDGTAYDRFGFSVSLSDNRALIGAYLDDDNAGNSGSAYVYDFDDAIDSWLETKLTASDGAFSDHFGSSVSLSGNRILVGAALDDNNNDINSGSTYLYNFDPGSKVWLEAKITADDGATDDRFGLSVSLSGNRGLIGVPFDRDGENSGSAYVFNLDTIFDQIFFNGFE